MPGVNLSSPHDALNHLASVLMPILSIGGSSKPIRVHMTGRTRRTVWPSYIATPTFSPDREGIGMGIMVGMAVTKLIVREIVEAFAQAE